MRRRSRKEIKDGIFEVCYEKEKNEIGKSPYKLVWELPSGKTICYLFGLEVSEEEARAKIEWAYRMGYTDQGE
jgi:hypothetical protein